MLMDVGLDTGDILMKKETPIGENETSAELFDRLAVLGGELIIETLDLLEKGALTPKKNQDEALATPPQIDKITLSGRFHQVRSGDTQPNSRLVLMACRHSRDRRQAG